MANCIRCDHEMIEIPREEMMNEEFNEKEYKCPHCGAYHSYSLPEEEERGEYPYFQEDEPSIGGTAGHGYPGYCPHCGTAIVWSSDFMRSEVWGDIDESDDMKNEYGFSKEDSLATYVSCPHCGAYIEIVDEKATLQGNYPFYQNKD